MCRFGVGGGDGDELVVEPKQAEGRAKKIGHVLLRLYRGIVSTVLAPGCLRDAPCFDVGAGGKADRTGEVAPYQSRSDHLEVSK